VDAEGNSNRLSTNKAHFVDEMGLCGCHDLPRSLSEPSRNPSGGLPLKLLAYWEEAEHAAGVDEQDVLCANECAALFEFVKRRTLLCRCKLGPELLPLCGLHVL